MFALEESLQKKYILFEMGVTGLCDSLARVLAFITILLLRVYHVKSVLSCMILMEAPQILLLSNGWFVIKCHLFQVYF